MKKSILTILLLTGVLLILYIILCLYVSFKVDRIAKASFQSYGKVNIYPKDISDRNFHLMCYRNDEHREYNEIYEENWRSFPLTLVLFNKANSWYWYDYSSAFYKGHDVTITINLRLKNFRWIITDVNENP